MNYLRAYVNLIRKSQNQSEPDIYEKHHVFPKSVYGKNNYVVKLSPRQHYVAHALLYKAFKNRYGSNHPKTHKMICAFNAMHSKSQKYKYINSRLYERLRKDFSESISGANNPFYGKTHTEETKQKMRKPKPSVRGKNHYLWNKTVSDQTRKKQSDAKKGDKNPMFGKQISDSHREKLRETKAGKNHPMFGRRGKNNPRYGLRHSEEVKEKMRTSSTGKLHSEETKAKIGAAFKGRKWWTNGIEDILAMECPNGFYPGRSAIKKNK
jgi:hypothetical protein